METCPYCRSELGRRPARAMRCPTCEGMISVRSTQIWAESGSQEIFPGRTIFTEDERIAIDTLNAVNSTNSLIGMMSGCGMLGDEFVEPCPDVPVEISIKEYRHVESTLSARLNRPPHITEVVRCLVEEVAEKYNPFVYFNLALFLAELGQDYFPALRRFHQAPLSMYLQHPEIVTGVTVAADPNSCCDACRVHAGQQYSVQDAIRLMPIPCPDCSSRVFASTDGFCRCRYIPVAACDLDDVGVYDLYNSMFQAVNSLEIRRRMLAAQNEWTRHGNPQTATHCPHCDQQLEKIPKANARCPVCRERIRVRTSHPFSPYTLFTAGEAAAIDLMTELENAGFTIRNFNEVRRSLVSLSGREPALAEAVWALFEQVEPSMGAAYGSATAAEFLAYNGQDYMPRLREVFRLHLMSFKEIGFERVRIHSDGCAACARDDGRELSTDEAIAEALLPHSDTENPDGSVHICRCIYIPVGQPDEFDESDECEWAGEDDGDIGDAIDMS